MSVEMRPTDLQAVTTARKATGSDSSSNRYTIWRGLVGTEWGWVGWVCVGTGGGPARVTDDWRSPAKPTARDDKNAEASIDIHHALVEATDRLKLGGGCVWRRRNDERVASDPGHPQPGANQDRGHGRRRRRQGLRQSCD